MSNENWTQMWLKTPPGGQSWRENVLKIDSILQLLVSSFVKRVTSANCPASPVQMLTNRNTEEEVNRVTATFVLLKANCPL